MFLDSMSKIEPDLIISYRYKYLIKPDIINRFMNSIINLHNSFLPWNRGTQPNFWSFLLDTPKGVTIHLINEGIDTGDILFQKRIEFNDGQETLRSSYEKLNISIQELFKNNWDRIKNKSYKFINQNSEGSIYYKKDFEKIRNILGPYGWDIPIKLLKKRYQKYLNLV